MTVKGGLLSFAGARANGQVAPIPDARRERLPLGSRPHSEPLRRGAHHRRCATTGPLLAPASAVRTPSETSVVQKQEHVLRSFPRLVDDLGLRRLVQGQQHLVEDAAFNNPANTWAAARLSRTLQPSRFAHRSR